MKRWEFLRTVGSAAAATTIATGTAVAQEDGGGVQVQPGFDGYLDGVDGGYEDLRGQSEVTIEIGASGNGGNLALAPVDIRIDPDTAVTWEWTGEDGGHNVVASEDASLDPGATVPETGSTYECAFENGGITKYHCVSHEALGMLGAVAVGDDMAIISTDGGGEEELYELGVPIQTHWVGSATILGILITIIYTFFVSKYGESSNMGNTGGGE